MELGGFQFGKGGLFLSRSSSQAKGVPVVPNVDGERRRPSSGGCSSTARAELSEEEVARFRIVFNKFDKDGGGTIDAEELGSAMHALGQNPTRVELQDMIEAVDVDKSGTIDFSEFLEMMRTKMEDMDTEEDVVDTLALFDPAGSGSVSQAVLRHALLNIGEKMTPEEVDFVFERLPKNAEGKFDHKAIAQTLLS